MQSEPGGGSKELFMKKKKKNITKENKSTPEAFGHESQSRQQPAMEVKIYNPEHIEQIWGYKRSRIGETLLRNRTSSMTKQVKLNLMASLCTKKDENT